MNDVSLAKRRSDLTVVALTCGQLSGSDLWSLRRISQAGYRPIVIRAEKSTDISGKKRFKRLVREYGMMHVLSRQIGKATIGRRHARRANEMLSNLFELPEQNRWWQEANLETVSVSHFNAADCRHWLTQRQPDVMIRISGGIVRQKTFEIPRLATLNIHHGMAPEIRGMWSIPWALVEQRPEWIGATVHRIDSGIDTGSIYWKGAPQLAPGDTGETLFYRAHLQAVEGLVAVLDSYSNGQQPPVMARGGESAYRTAPGMIPWLRYRHQRAGWTSRLLLERAIQ